MNVGIIGTGTIAQAHAEAIHGCPELTLTAACDTDQARLNAFCLQHKTRGFSDYRALLDSGVDIAAVTLPHALHHPVGMDVCGHGCHLVMEKPFAVTMDQCRELYRRAREKGVRVITADSAYHLPEVVHAKELIRTRKLGRFISGSFINYKNYFTPGRPQWFLRPELAGGGQLINVGVHRIALIRAMVGDGEISVKASVGFFQPHCSVEGNGSIFIGYQDGSAVLLEENGYYAGSKEQQSACHFNFEQGIVNLGGKLSLVFRDGTVEYPKIPAQKGNSYLPVYRKLLSALAENKQPYPSDREGILDVRIILAAYASAREGKEVRLDSPAWRFP